MSLTTGPIGIGVVKGGRFTGSLTDGQVAEVVTASGPADIHIAGGKP